MFPREGQERPTFLVPLDGSRLAESVLPTIEALAGQTLQALRALIAQAPH